MAREVRMAREVGISGVGELGDGTGVSSLVPVPVR